VRLVVDANILVGELLRLPGRGMLRDERLEPIVSEYVFAEAGRHLRRRIPGIVKAKGLPPEAEAELWRMAKDVVTWSMVRVGQEVYTAYEEEARWRSCRDPKDWPIVACALALDAGVWTEDCDFLGAGLSTWRTDTLRTWLTVTDEPPCRVLPTWC
jgi:predicted nucleic acid-binding protein